jgi:HEAT repeat protein
LSISKLANLSDPTDEEIELLGSAWPGIAADRRLRIARELVEMAEDNAEYNFDRVFRLCLKDPDESVQTTALDGLSQSEDPAVIDDLLDRLQHAGTETVRAAAAISLGGFVLQAELGRLSPRHAQRIKEALLAVVHSPRASVVERRRAVEAVSALSSPEVQEAIEGAYRSPTPELQISAIYAMGRNCDPRWFPTLVKELSSPDTEKRFEAAGACGELGDERAVARLVPLLQDRDDEVQLAAIDALGRIGGGEAMVFLDRLQQDATPEVRQALEAALSELNFAEDPLSS